MALEVAAVLKEIQRYHLLIGQIILKVGIEIPHFLCWYYEKYHVEYFVEYRGNSFSWKHFFSLKHLHIEDGDVVVDKVNNVRYLIVNNPSTGQLEHHKIYE